MAQAPKAVPTEQKAPDNTVSAKLKDDARIVSVQYDFGSNLDASRKLFGDEVVHNNFQAQAVISCQALIRRGIKAKKNDADIAKMVSEWKPGTKSIVRKSAQEKIKDAFGGMSAEQKAALLAELKADMAA